MDAQGRQVSLLSVVVVHRMDPMVSFSLLSLSFSYGFVVVLILSAS